jgi:RNA polymerase sigma-70 factor, ECF subfamily
VKDIALCRHKLINERWAMDNDQATFREVYREFLGPIRAYLARRVPHGDVEDLAADVFAVAWKKRTTVTRGEELPWLYRIASYVVANYRRKERHRLDRLWLFHEPDSSPGPDTLRESDPAVGQAWTKLTPAERELLALVIVEEVAVNDVATIMGVTPNAISIRLHRAKKRLATLLEESSLER